MQNILRKAIIFLHRYVIQFINSKNMYECRRIIKATINRDYIEIANHDRSNRHRIRAIIPYCYATDS